MGAAAPLAQGRRAGLRWAVVTHALPRAAELNPPTDQTGAPSAAATDVALIGRIGAVPTILRILCETTGLGFAAVARVTETSWTACAVLDKTGFGLEAGGELEVATTFCREIRASRRPVVIDKASEDPVYCGHPTPKLYGFESYVAVPIVKRSGEVFGTICALDRKPAALRDAKALPTLELFAELIAAQIELEERLDTSHSPRWSTRPSWGPCGSSSSRSSATTCATPSPPWPPGSTCCRAARSTRRPRRWSGR